MIPQSTQAPEHHNGHATPLSYPAQTQASLVPTQSLRLGVLGPIEVKVDG